jgi:hypothetical protein
VISGDFLPCKAAYYNIIYRYENKTDFVNVGIKLLNIETKETDNEQAGDLPERTGLLFWKFVY